MSGSPKYVDHPAPSVFMMTLVLFLVIVIVVSLPEITRDGASPISWVLVGGTLAVVLFYCWPLSTTYYTLSADGIQVRYGPWTRRFPWSDFSAAYWQKGVFATRIGMPSATPCVRLTDAVLLKRPSKWFGLYLTPNDSRAFLMRIGEFAPELTRETVL
jgi:hypothetical protein